MSKSQLELQEFAEGFRTYYSSLNPTAGTPDEVYKIEQVDIAVPTAAKSIKGRIYIPTEKANADKFPLVLFSHGGCLISGDLETHDVLARALALRLNAVVLAYDYTLAPEENALGQMEEAKAAFNWLYDHADQYNGDVNQFVGIGDSAGGQITANLSHIYTADAERKFAAVWLIYPVLSINLQTESFKKLGEKYFPSSEVMHMGSLCFMPKDVSDKDPRILSLYANHANLAPTFISIGELDPLSSDSFTYAEDLKVANIAHALKFYPKSEHGFIQYFKNKEAHVLGEQALDDGIAQLKSWLS